MNLDVRTDQVVQELETLAAFSDVPAPAVSRIVFTETDRKARAWLWGLCSEAALIVRADAVGNTFARWEGSAPELPAVGSGSHIDAIPHSGRYDGTVGVLGALEAIRALQRAGFRPRRSIELLLFTSEEPTRFGIGCLGSRLLSGTLSAEAASKLADDEGKSLDEVRHAAGITGDLQQIKLPDGYYKAFVELHIEQGPILEREHKPLGIVERIAAPSSLRVIIQGSGGHAGGVLMPDRHDALCAAAELILTLENAARASGAIDTVATVGICDVFPGAVNSIPARVRLSVDVRDTDVQRRDRVVKALEETSRAASSRRGVEIHSELLNADSPAESGPEIVNTVARACKKYGFDFLRMTSRAYHDSLFMSRIAPVAMLFIPCRNGYSHRPDEYASPEDIARGALVLAESLAELAS